MPTVWQPPLFYPAPLRTGATQNLYERRAVALVFPRALFHCEINGLREAKATNSQMHVRKRSYQPLFRW